METDENKRCVYEFGKFVLDPQEKTLFADGTAIHLPAKEFETLLLLVENSGKALTKEEMIAAIWQNTFVEENNLAKYVSRLRKIFNAGGETLIETLPKHGYRFSAEVRRTLHVFEEPVILEKRTRKKLSVKVEEEIPQPMLPALPAKKRKRFWVAGLIVLSLCFLIVLVGLILFRQRQQPVKQDGDGIIFLTDGRYDYSGAYWTNQGQIYFSKYVTNTRVESWMMNADGTNQRRANTEIKNLLNGRWSPDGTKVIFRKEGDDKPVYLADADGKNEIVLPFEVGNMDWSSDGSQFVYQAKNSAGMHEIFLYTLKTRKNVNLTGATHGADPSFSYDGKQIAFTSLRDGNAEIYVIDVDGSNVRRLTNHPAFDNYPVFSPDGTQIAFQSNRENERTEVFLKNLNDDSPPRRITDLNIQTAIAPKCWSADGTQILLRTDKNGKDQILLANVEPFPARLVLNDETDDLSLPRLAPDGKQILYQAQLADHSIELRLTDLETKKTRTIFKTDPVYPNSYYLTPAWSPDGKQIVFNGRANGNSEIFIINVDGSGLRNLTNDPLVDTYPVFSPDGNEIIFTRDSYGVARIYRMNLDGGNQRLITEKNGYEITPTFSPDGSSLAFAGDRANGDSRGLDIFLLNLKNPNDEKVLVSRRFHDTTPTFSPDGKKIAFIATSDGNAEIYLMNSDGTGLFRLTHSKAEETAPQFSKDGKRLIFASNRSGKFAVYEIELP